MISKQALTKERLLSVLRRFTETQLVIWGDLVVDEFLLGQVNRISREAPVLILDYLRSERVPGGAANTAANVAALGARALPVGSVGRDQSGKDLLFMLNERGVDTSSVAMMDELVTPTKTRVSAAGLHTTRQQIVRIDRGRPHSFSRTHRARLAQLVEKKATAAHGLVVADYGYRTVDPAAVRVMAPRLRAASKPVAVDSRWRLLEFRGATAVTPNEPEMEAALGVSLRRGQQPDLERAATDLLKRLGCHAVLVTRGSRGMAVFQHDTESGDYIPVYGSDQVADVTGAGDTVMATFSIALAAGANPFEAARLANYAGGLVVMKQGTATVTLAELRAALSRDNALPDTPPTTS
ncbi:MAG: bifunctional heptose 7-phosphate kinase/heptose 1-phosphate adenyltransferase [Acidobacteriota bacterium]